MFFNSIAFAIFLPVAFLLYWFIFNRNINSRNVFIVVISYIFYGWWDWRFLTLIFFSSIVDYTVSLAIEKTKVPKIKKLYLYISLIANLGILGIFKYYNFFVDSLLDLNPGLQHILGDVTLNIVLPVGISFYTFQTLSYTIDVYRGKLKATKDPVAFLAFVSFFPQLVAGPIERATNLLPQFHQTKRFDYKESIDGLKQILWGLFKKIVIADTCAVYVNEIFANYTEQSGGILLLGAVFFAFQIYGDFSGYSDIAIGTAKLFGFSLMKNFAYPYFSRDIAEFWRRWHISLSTWFRDYLYIPLGGSKRGKSRSIINIFIIFVVSGFWHGANWTFIAWGFLNALYYLPIMLTNYNRKNIDIVAANSKYPSFKEILAILLTFFFTCIAWIFFRAESITIALDYISLMFASIWDFSSDIELNFLIFILVFVIWEWNFRKQPHGLSFTKTSHLGRWLSYTTMIILIFYFFGNETAFIYFQF